MAPAPIRVLVRPRGARSGSKIQIDDLPADLGVGRLVNGRNRTMPISHHLLSEGHDRPHGSVVETGEVAVAGSLVQGQKEVLLRVPEVVE